MRKLNKDTSTPRRPVQPTMAKHNSSLHQYTHIFQSCSPTCAGTQQRYKRSAAGATHHGQAQLELTPRYTLNRLHLQEILMMVPCRGVVWDAAYTTQVHGRSDTHHGPSHIANIEASVDHQPTPHQALCQQHSRSRRTSLSSHHSQHMACTESPRHQQPGHAWCCRHSLPYSSVM